MASSSKKLLTSELEALIENCNVLKMLKKTSEKQRSSFLNMLEVKDKVFGDEMLMSLPRRLR